MMVGWFEKLAKARVLASMFEPPFPKRKTLVSPLPSRTLPSPPPVKLPALSVPRAPTGGPTSGVEQWDNFITQAANEYKVPAEVVKAIMDIESGGNRAALSKAGAIGLMQTMPFHYSANENPWDPLLNIRRGTSILRSGYDRYGNWNSAAAAYFGAIDPRTGLPTGATDGTVSGNQYVRLFLDALRKYQQGA